MKKTNLSTRCVLINTYFPYCWWLDLQQIKNGFLLDLDLFFPGSGPYSPTIWHRFSTIFITFMILYLVNKYKNTLSSLETMFFKYKLETKNVCSFYLVNTLKRKAFKFMQILENLLTIVWKYGPWIRTYTYIVFEGSYT